MIGYKFIEKGNTSYFKLQRPTLLSAALIIALGLGTGISPILVIPKPVPTVIVAQVQHKEVDSQLPILVSWIKTQNTNISSEVASSIVTSSKYWANKYNLDPLLVLSLISVESKFDMFAISGSNALGLMQIIPKWHKDKVRGINPFDIHSNIHIGTLILREYIDMHGSTERALLRYNGALNAPNKYAKNVLQTRSSLKDYINNRA